MDKEELELAYNDENLTIYIEGEFGIEELSELIAFLMSKIAEQITNENQRTNS